MTAACAMLLITAIGAEAGEKKPVKPRKKKKGEVEQVDTAKVERQSQVAAQNAGQVHLGTGGSVHTANRQVAVEAQRKAERCDQVAHQGCVVNDRIEGVYAAESEVQQFHNQPHCHRHRHRKQGVVK